MESNAEKGSSYSFYKGLIQFISKAENQREEILVVKKLYLKQIFKDFISNLQTDDVFLHSVDFTGNELELPIAIIGFQTSEAHFKWIYKILEFVESLPKEFRSSFDVEYHVYNGNSFLKK